MFLVLFVQTVFAFVRDAYQNHSLKRLCDDASFLPIALVTVMLGDSHIRPHCYVCSNEFVLLLLQVLFALPPVGLPMPVLPSVACRG